MLADLVGGGGCIVEGSDTVNNPLSRLGKAVLDAGRQRDVAGPSSGMASSHLAGPSSGMLPSMGPEEAAFLQSFNNASLHSAWEKQVSSSGHPLGPMQHMPPGMHGGMAEAWAKQRGIHDGMAEAWSDTMNMGGHMAAQAAAAEAAWLEATSASAPVYDPVLEGKQAQAGQEVRGLMHRMMSDTSQAADLASALASLQLPPEVQAAAERRASNMFAHLRPL